MRHALRVGTADSRKARMRGRVQSRFQLCGERHESLVSDHCRVRGQSSEALTAASGEVVNIPTRKATAVRQRADFAFGQTMIVYEIADFPVLVRRPINLRTMDFQCLDDPLRIGLFLLRHPSPPSRCKFVCTNSERHAVWDSMFIT